MIRQLATDGWECHVAVPAPARLATEYAAAGALLHIVAMEHPTTSGPIWRWLVYVLRWPASVGRLWRLARRLDVDVVHSNSLHCWHGWAAAVVARRPHVWHAREIVFQSKGALSLERFLARRFAQVVVAVSGAVAAQLDPANVEIISDSADESVFRPDRAGVFRASAGIAEGTPLLGSVARIDVWKGFDVLLDAFVLMRSRRPTLELVVAGNPVPGKEDYAAALERRAAAMEGVRWLGPRDDVPELLADLDVFAQVSTEPEPFGLVVVEALASGVPVVAGAAGGPLEVMGRDGFSSPMGRLVPAGEAAALADAVLALLPDGASSTESRRARRPLRQVIPPQFADLFDAVAFSGRPRPDSRLSRRRPPLPR
jgi:glycosyltransferase involved in cell wall biosynthesis